MAYIIVDFQGKGSFGGFLKVDGGKQIALSDDMMIYVSAGTHYLEFSSISSADRRLNNLNAAWGSTGNTLIAALGERHAVDGKITEDFSEHSVMLFTVVSDGSGHVLDLPQYTIQTMTEDEYKKFDEMYEARVSAQEAHEKKTAGIEFWLCLLLGWLGAHKFYRGKIGMGLAYLFTCGLFCCGWGIDAIVLLVKYIKAKRS